MLFGFDLDLPKLQHFQTAQVMNKKSTQNKGSKTRVRRIVRTSSFYKINDIHREFMPFEPSVPPGRSKNTEQPGL